MDYDVNYSTLIFRIKDKKEYRLKKAFGIDDLGNAILPRKISNVKISRFQNFDKMGGCSYCFPHGIECTNAILVNQTRNWKKHRKTQWKKNRPKACFIL